MTLPSRRPGPRSSDAGTQPVSGGPAESPESPVPSSRLTGPEAGPHTTAEGDTAGSPLLELPWDRPPTERRQPAAGAVGFDVPAASVTGLRDLVRECGGTLSDALLGLFMVLLHRYSGQVGITVARTGQDGPVAVRADVGSETSFAGLMRALEDGAAMASAPEDLAGLPGFSFRSPSEEARDAVPATPSADGTVADLEVRFVLGDERLTGELVFATDVFDESTARRTVGHLLTLADSAWRDRDRSPSDLTLLTPQETRTFAALNAVAVPASGSTFHQLFEEQAGRTPDRTALRAHDSVLTFGQLNERANQLAHLLRERGVRPGVTAGIRTDRGARAVVSMLAVLKAGGAYVPVDEAEPAARREAILQDAGVAVEIVMAGSPAADAAPAGRPTVELRTDWAGLDGRPTGNTPAAETAPTDAAYLLYTSGTTGRPKGVVVENRQLSGYVQALVHRLGAGEPMNWAVVQPLSVDSSVTALMPPLCTGGEAHLIPRESVLDADALADWAQRWRVDCMKIAPSHLRALQSSPRFRDLLPRRRLIVGCEASDWRWLRDVQRLVPDCRVVNHYGPTETTVGVVTLDVTEHADGDWETAPIGFPLPGARVHVVDPLGRPVPAGVVGEIAIGGATVARGYHARPDLNAAVFVPDTLGGDPDGRLFLTGDFARRHPDGMITYLGRRDDQVKVRGFRVALGEIDAVLRGHPEVRNAVTLMREDTAGDRRLVAYVEPHARDAFRAPALDAYAAERLPSHMVPQAVVVMDALPLAGNGKVSRSALPRPAAPEAAAGRARFAAGSDLQRRIAGAWSEVLRAEVPGADQNFFDVGGHSLLLVALQQALEKATGRKVNMLDLFAHTTVRQQAELLARPDGDQAVGSPGRRSTAQQNALTRRRNEQLRAKRGRS